MLYERKEKLKRKKNLLLSRSLSRISLSAVQVIFDSLCLIIVVGFINPSSLQVFAQLDSIWCSISGNLCML